MTNKFDLSFLDRSLKTTGILLLIFLPVGFYYFSSFTTLAIFTGGVWGIINLIFLSALVRSTIRPEGANKFRAAGLLLIKFPLLYLSGYFLLKVSQFEPFHLMIGFTSLFGVIFLKVLGRLFLALDEKNQTDEHLQKAL